MSRGAQAPLAACGMKTGLRAGFFMPARFGRMSRRDRCVKPLPRHHSASIAASSLHAQLLCFDRWVKPAPRDHCASIAASSPHRAIAPLRSPH